MTVFYRFWRHRLYSAISLVLLLFFLTSCAAQDKDIRPSHGPDECINTAWPQEKSDLQPDPNVHFGRLANGLRYVILENHEPKNRIALYLDVQAGSLNETDDQRGYAHYLEHMLFNGTAHFPPGSLIEYFQSIGMGFGADTNAHTSYDETVYKLLLPDTKSSTLDTGMLVLADYARRALLLESEVDHERGVILAEKRSRDSAEARVSKALLKKEFAGTRVAVRDPIGVEKTLLAATGKKLRAFYDAWYRPENMVVVLVGDIGQDAARISIKKHFAELEAAPVTPRCYDFGRIDEGSRVFVNVPEPDLGRTDLSISFTWNISPEPDTSQREQELFANYVAARVLGNRLRQVVDQVDSPLTRAQAYSGTFVRRLGYFVLTGRTTASQWQEGLGSLRTVLAQVQEYDVDPAELARVTREIRAELSQAVKTEATRDSGKLAMDIIRKLNDSEVILSPKQEQQLYGRFLDELNVKDVRAAFTKMTSDATRQVVFVGGNADLTGSAAPEKEIETVWEKALATGVLPWQKQETVRFPYLPPPAEKGRIDTIIHHEKIDATTTIFAGGLRLNVKKTDFSAGEVQIQVHFGHGTLTQPAPGLAKLAEAVVNESGVGRLTRDQLDAVLAGTTARVQFKVGPESFQFSGKGLSSELKLLVQLVYTGLVDPAFRPEAYARSMRRFRQMYQAMRGSVEGTYQLEGDRFFSGGNPRYGLPPEKDFFRLGLDQARAWLQESFAHDPLEITVVGDIDPDRVRQLIATWFGSRKARPYQSMHGEGVRFPAGKKHKIMVGSAVAKEMLVVGWWTNDFWDISRTRRLSVLASLVEDRLRKTVREELGATYSPMAYNYASRVDPGYGVLRALITIDPGQAGVVREAVFTVARDIAEKTVSGEELGRIIAPIQTSIRDLQRTNRYWLESVLALSGRHPDQLSWPLTIVEDFASITPAEIQELAGQYLQEKRSAILEIISTGNIKNANR